MLPEEHVRPRRGPTGVEVAAELHDMIQEDLRKIYPDLMKDVTIRLIELQVPFLVHPLRHVLLCIDRHPGDEYAHLLQRLRTVWPLCHSLIAVRHVESRSNVLHGEFIPSVQDHILSTYDRAISAFTQTEFGRSGITCVLNTRVSSIGKGEVSLVSACVRHPGAHPATAQRAPADDPCMRCCRLTKEEYTIPFGACVWVRSASHDPDHFT